MVLKTKSALSYFGSDSEVASDLAAMLNHCKHVTIPFCGGLSILPHLEARAIVANDLHDLAINFYRMLASGRKQMLIDMCDKTLSHPSEIKLAEEVLTVDRESSSSLAQAWAFWALCWIGRKGKGGTKHQGGMPSVRRTANGGTNASRIRAAANDLEQWATQFERCEWESICFRQLLPKVADNPTCGIYCDPPWVDVGRNYLYSFTDDDHSELEFSLRRFTSATVVVRYGDCATVRDLYSDPHWEIIEASSRDQCNAVKGELWITNCRHK